MTKVLLILHHSASVLSVDLKTAFFGWHALYGKELAKRTDYEVECLMHDPKVRSIITCGTDVVYKAFPTTVSLKVGLEYSHSLIRYIEHYLSEKNLIIHIMGDSNFLAYAIARKFQGRPVIIQNLGYPGKPWLGFVERLLYPNNVFFFVISKAKKDYLLKYVRVNPRRVKIQNIGVDTNFFKPLPRNECRRIIGLPENKKYVLYVGQFYELKGLPLVIKVVQNLKKEYDIELVAVGGYKSDPLYSIVKKKVKYSFDRCPHNSMRLFYNAADVIVLYMRDPRWGGPGIAVEEAMACNIPIISNTLIHVGSQKNLQAAGCYIPREFEDIELYIRKILSSNNAYNTRSIALRYFNWDNIINDTISVYQNMSTYLSIS